MVYNITEYLSCVKRLYVEGHEKYIPSILNQDCQNSHELTDKCVNRIILSKFRYKFFKNLDGFDGFDKKEQNGVQRTQSDILKPCSFVVGNESCDLDSFISSFLVSYFEGYVQLISMKKKYFMRKREIRYICDLFQISLDSLYFIEKVITLCDNSKVLCILNGSKTLLLRLSALNVILVDHNFSNIFIKAQKIFDHHAPEGFTPSDERLIDETAGSCVSVIFQYYKSLIDGLNPRNLQILSDMILLPLFIDTNFLTVRTGLADLECFKHMRKRSTIEHKTIIKTIKNFSEDELMWPYLDYKERTYFYDEKGIRKKLTIGISVTKKSLENQNTSVIEEFMREKELGALFIMSMFENQRFLFVFGFDKKIFEERSLFIGENMVPLEFTRKKLFNFLNEYFQVDNSK